MDSQVQGDEDDFVEEEVDSLGPAAHGSVAAPVQLRKEEGAEAVHLPPACFLLRPCHHQVKVEIDHLTDRQRERINVLLYNSNNKSESYSVIHITGLY